MDRAPRSPSVLGLGLACLDYLFLAPWAERGHYARVRDHVVCGGGLIGTAAAAAARLGARAEIWTWVGDDDEGGQVIAGLRAEGVDTTGVEVVPGARTPVSFVHVEEGTGERTIFHRPRLELPSDRADAVADRSLSCDVLLVDATWPEASKLAARRAREVGIPVVGDFRPEGPGAELASLVTHLIVSHACGERLAPDGSWEERLRRLADFGPELAAITSGAEGCYYLEATAVERKGPHAPPSSRPIHPGPDLGGPGIRHQPAFSVPVVDTTGAGDVFHGAFAYALARGWPSGESIAFASAAAALSCCSLGGRAGLPDLADTCRLLGWESPGPGVNSVEEAGR